MLAERAMGSLLIGDFATPVHNDAGFGLGPEDFLLQGFVSQPAMEGFHESVLPRAPRLNQDWIVSLSYPKINSRARTVFVEWPHPYICETDTRCVGLQADRAGHDRGTFGGFGCRGLGSPI